MKLEENLKEIENLEDADFRKPGIPKKVDEQETMPTFPSHADLLRTRVLHSRGRGGSCRYLFYGVYSFLVKMHPLILFSSITFTSCV